MRVLRGLLVGLAIVAATSVAAEGTKPLHVAIVSRTIFYLPVRLAAEKGYFKDEGLDLRIDVFGNAEKINGALRENAVQIAVSTPEWEDSFGQ